MALASGVASALPLSQGVDVTVVNAPINNSTNNNILNSNISANATSEQPVIAAAYAERARRADNYPVTAGDPSWDPLIQHTVQSKNERLAMASRYFFHHKELVSTTKVSNAKELFNKHGAVVIDAQAQFMDFDTLIASERLAVKELLGEATLAILLNFEGHAKLFIGGKKEAEQQQLEKFVCNVASNAKSMTQKTFTATVPWNHPAMQAGFSYQKGFLGTHGTVKIPVQRINEFDLRVNCQKMLTDHLLSNLVADQCGTVIFAQDTKTEDRVPVAMSLTKFGVDAAFIGGTLRFKTPNVPTPESGLILLNELKAMHPNVTYLRFDTMTLKTKPQKPKRDMSKVDVFLNKQFSHWQKKTVIAELTTFMMEYGVTLCDKGDKQNYAVTQDASDLVKSVKMILPLEMAEKIHGVTMCEGYKFTVPFIQKRDAQKAARKKAELLEIMEKMAAGTPSTALQADVSNKRTVVGVGYNANVETAKTLLQPQREQQARQHAETPATTTTTTTTTTATTAPIVTAEYIHQRTEAIANEEREMEQLAKAPGIPMEVQHVGWLTQNKGFDPEELKLVKQIPLNVALERLDALNDKLYEAEETFDSLWFHQQVMEQIQASYALGLPLPVTFVYTVLHYIASVELDKLDDTMKQWGHFFILLWDSFEKEKRSGEQGMMV